MRNVLFSTVMATMSMPLVLLSVHAVDAQVRQSSSYQIQSDSINFGGGRSSSTNFVQESTFGEVGTGRATSTSYELRAGYQQMLDVFISISGASTVSMTPSLPGISGGIANGSTTVTVITDSLSGYELTIKASTSPAMQKGADSIADYVPATSDPDYAFETDATDAHFGYTPEGVDVVQRFLDDAGSNCNQPAGSDTAFACWDGLDTTPEAIASSAAANHPAGATTTVKFRVGIGGSVVQPAGVYTATTTLTALPL